MAIDISEIPDISRRRTISFYAVLALVLPLWSAVPLAWGFVVYALYTGRIWSYSSPRIALFTLSLAEVLFSVYHFHLQSVAFGSSKDAHGSVPENMQLAFERILKAGLAHLPPDGFDEETLDEPRPGSPAEAIVQLEPNDPRAVDFRNTLRTWFGRGPWSTVRLHEVRQWLYWSIFNKELPALEKLARAHRTVLDSTLDLLQKRLGKPIPEGRSKIKPILLNLDKPNILWRPFTFYALIAIINLMLDHRYQRTYGFHHGNLDGLEYLVRIPKSWKMTRGPRPLVYLHGLGLGLFQYHSFLSRLIQEFADRPILILLQPHISQNIFHPRYLSPMPRKEATEKLASLLASFGWAECEPNSGSSGTSEDEVEDTLNPKKHRSSGVTVLSHSNGSYCHAWMLKDYPHMITRSCFVDPVTFCGWEGDVCRNFFYKTCTTGSELFVRYFVGTELGVVNLLQRNFDWCSNSLWYEEIPNARDPSKTLFLLGDKDSIINPARVKLYLRSHGVRKGLWCDPNGRHGQALLAGGEGCKMVYEWLKECRS